MIDNIELVDGELIINEKLGIQVCDAFFSKVLHNKFGGLFCNMFVKNELDKIIKGIVADGVDTRIGEHICRAIHFCE
ncbi:hypothetical protein CRE_08541 [Caenorhabditis remanei]|uniref:Saposin B-type domain-containing protein n=1 Tax=Caenorhabditis remanei TaxID=31234 RepID=E3NB85_CAERE|nr:hypothetical protein CRE_08541 [Caenorhabditis remanei]